MASTTAGFYQVSPSTPASFLTLAAPVLHLNARGVTSHALAFAQGPADAGRAASRWSAAVVRLSTDADLPITAYAGYDGVGPSEAGGSWRAGGAWSHPFDTSQVISYGIQREDNGRFTSDTFSDVLAATEGRQVLFSGSFASSHTDTPSQDGYSNQGSVTYIRHNGAWSSQFGVSLASTDMGLAFNAVSLLPGAAKTAEILILCKGAEHDHKGQTTILSQTVLGRAHGLTGAAVPELGSGYAYERLDLSRTAALLGGFTLVSALRMQIAKGTLFDSARLDAGDLGSVYMHGAGLVPLSEGVVTGQQIGGPAADIGEVTGIPALDEERLRGGFFWSYASLRQPSTAGATIPAETVVTAGVSVECSPLAKMVVDVHLGWQRIRTAQPDRAGPFGQAALSFNF